MLMDREASDGASSDVSRQFQVDQHFLEEMPAQSAISTVDSEVLAGFGDISLLMRQFYQSPARSAG